VHQELALGLSKDEQGRMAEGKKGKAGERKKGWLGNECCTAQYLMLNEMNEMYDEMYHVQVFTAFSISTLSSNKEIRLLQNASVPCNMLAQLAIISSLIILALGN